MYGYILSTRVQILQRDQLRCDNIQLNLMQFMRGHLQRTNPRQIAGRHLSGQCVRARTPVGPSLEKDVVANTLLRLRWEALVVRRNGSPCFACALSLRQRPRPAFFQS